MKSGNSKWASVREVAARVGRSEATIRTWVKAGRVKSRKVRGRVQVHWPDAEKRANAIDSVSRGRPPRKRTRSDVVADPAIPLAEFAERAGLNQRTVQRMRQRGEIHRYTEAELRKLLERQADGEAGGEAGELNPATVTAVELEDAALADIKRAKEFQAWRLAKLRADREEGKVYDAEGVEAKVRTMATATRGALEQLYLVLPQRLAGKTSAQIREQQPDRARARVEFAEPLSRAVSGVRGVSVARVGAADLDRGDGARPALSVREVRGRAAREREDGHAAARNVATGAAGAVRSGRGLSPQRAVLAVAQVVGDRAQLSHGQGVMRARRCTR